MDPFFFIAFCKLGFFFFGVRNGEAEKPYRMLLEVYFRKLLFGQRKDILQSMQLFVNTNTACNLSKIVKFYFQCKCTALKIFGL